MLRSFLSGHNLVGYEWVVRMHELFQVVQKHLALLFISHLALWYRKCGALAPCGFPRKPKAPILSLQQTNAAVTHCTNKQKFVTN